MAEDAVFLSYAWGVDDDLVDHLYKRLIEEGFKAERDKKSIEYKGSISDFMNRLSDGGAVVIVLSDKYLESVYCMIELYEIWHRHKDFRDRIFPFVLPDAFPAFEYTTRYDYAEYWQQEKKALNDALHRVGYDTAAKADRRLLHYMRSFENSVPEILAEIADLNVKSDPELNVLTAAVLKRVRP